MEAVHNDRVSPGQHRIATESTMSDKWSITIFTCDSYVNVKLTEGLRGAIVQEGRRAVGLMHCFPKLWLHL